MSTTRVIAKRRSAVEAKYRSPYEGELKPKTCKRCQTHLPADEFSKRYVLKNDRWYLNAYCHKCMRDKKHNRRLGIEEEVKKKEIKIPKRFLTRGVPHYAGYTQL